MPHEIKSAGIQSPRGLLCARLSYQFLPKALPGLRGAHYSAETRRRRFAENRSAATLGGPKLASAATPHPTAVSLASKTPNFIGSKCATQTRSSVAPGSWPKIDHLTTALRTGGRRAKPWPKPTRKIAPTGVSTMPKALIQPHHPPVNILGGYKFPDAPDVKLREEKEPGFALTASSTKSDDNLDIPDFLKR